MALSNVARDPQKGAAFYVSKSVLSDSVWYDISRRLR
jgi:hypothetical protein